MSTTYFPVEAASFVDVSLGEGWSAQPLAGDASARTYFRITLPGDRRTYILAYYPLEVRGQLQRFMDAYASVAPHARVPAVLKSSDSAILQRDAGDRTLYDLLHENREEGVRRYRDSVDLLVGFQKAPGREVNPPFTPGFFLAELDMAVDYYVSRLMEVPEQLAMRLDPFFRKLCENLARHPYVLCHRDFHGQNIHIVNETLYLLDYQDMRMGPDTYDMASLLRDRGVARVIGDETELELLDDYSKRSGAPGDVRRRYFESLLQRSIKILGTFAKLPITRGRMHYLDFIPPTLESIRRCMAELPEFAALADLLPMDVSVDKVRKRAESIKEK